MPARHSVGRVVAAVAFVAGTVSVGGTAHAAVEPPGPTPPGLDHFMCHSSDAEVTTDIARSHKVRLQDQFGTLDVTVAKKPDRLCNPTDKQHGPLSFAVAHPDAHLVCHSVKLPTGVTVPPHEVFVQNQFGNARLATRQPLRLCLPAWKSFEPEFPQGRQPPDLDHFLCYKVAYSTTVVNKFGNLGTVGLRNQFEAVDAKVAGPKELCNPVQKTLSNGRVTPVTNPDAHLVCHAITRDPAHSPKVVYFKHQLGSARFGTLASPTLCTPSFKDQAPPPGSCQPSSSLSVLVQGTNVVSYIPKGSWSGGATGISAVNVEGSSITPTLIATPNVVNSAASNPTTGVTVATANNTDVYLLEGTTLTTILTSEGSGTLTFSGGSPTNAGVTMDATHNRAVIGLAVAQGTGGFQFLDLGSNVLSPAFASPSGAISEGPLIDPIRNLLLSASEENNYELVDVSDPSSPQFYERSVTIGGQLDSSGEDCTTGIALAPASFTNPSQLFITDLTQATFTPGSPAGTWTAPSQVQTLTESSLTSGPAGLAVAGGTHIGVVTGEFGGNGITVLALPTTSGSGTPAILDWVTCAISNTWSQGLDPHTVTAYQTPNGGNAIGLFVNNGASLLARVDLTKLLDPTIVPRTAAGHACFGGTIPPSVEDFISVP